jgi:hypothetical protein
MFWELMTFITPVWLLLAGGAAFLAITHPRS